MSLKITIRKYDKKRGVPTPGLQRLDVKSSVILKMIQEGKGFEKTAKHFKISKSTICYRLKRDFPEEYKKLRINPTAAQYYNNCAKAYRAYKQTGTYHEAAKTLGLPETTVLGRIKFMERVLG